ncbi:MAG: TonB-dependent receptor [Pyrinomonadaceae bacterium]|nr:TonB-dependent receptor [Pyrinomonadaceae bacterium]
MKETAFRLLVRALIVGIVSAVSIPAAVGQSQALNGQIEGTVLDEHKAALPNAIITVTNIEAGATRTVTTDESGVYRVPLLPLGTYRITAEAANFKKLVREGVTLTTGQTATVDLNWPAGEIQEVVTVSSDTSIADTGKTDLGRVMNTREAQNLPLVSRNPLNFGILQANVNGRTTRGLAFPILNVNGYARRVNYQLDGSTNTQGDRATIRFMLISDVYVSEVQLLTNGFAAEFGNTTGMIMNMVTPSGTNALHGAVSYRFRRPSFYSRPFFYSASAVPDNKSDDFTAQVGAPIIKDRWHFYFGYEWIKRDDKAAAERVLTTPAADQARLIAAGLSPAIFPPAIPSLEKGTFYIFRNDAQLNNQNRLTARFNYADLISKNAIAGGLNTLERTFDGSAVSQGFAAQLASYTAKFLNEFRFQYAQRTNTGNGGSRNEFSGTGPSIVISGVANFGSPEGVTDILLTRRITQIQDNLTRNVGTHVVKFGGGFSFYNYTEQAVIFARYTFPSIDAYIAARHGTNPRSYTSYAETFGDPVNNYKATFWNFFVQDDWKLTRRLKFNYGLRYDLYRIPEADSTSPFSASQEFNVDKNNFAPRLGVVYALREGNRPTIIRAGAGIYYDAALLAMYQRALQNNGNARFFNFSFSGNTNVIPIPSPNAPAFPSTFSGSLPAGSVLPPQNIDTVAPDLENMYAIHAHFQLEQAISNDLSFAVGYIHSGGRHIPVYRGINMIPIRFLSDGRPVFGRLVNSSTRFDPRFNNILMVESAGVSEYNALTFQLTRRLSSGLQFSLNYTLSKATDDAPEQNLTTGNIQGLVLVDPNNRQLDKGTSFADQRHTFVMSLVALPQFRFDNKTLHYLFNNNQVGMIATANSGETFNIVSTSDINGDGATISDRPVGIKRNSGTTPAQFNVDLRYSRFFSFTERYKLEVFGEFQNFFNINSIVQFNNVTVTTNANGELIGGLPDFRARNQSTSQDSRQFQLGLKFIF